MPTTLDHCLKKGAMGDLLSHHTPADAESPVAQKGCPMSWKNTPDRKPDSLVPDSHAEEVALFRAKVIGALGHRDFHHGELRAELEMLSKTRFRPPGSDVTRSFSVTTLERWYYAHKSGGLGALKPKPRSDQGLAQELTAEQRELLLDIRREHPSISVTLILRTLILDGRLQQGAISESTVRRFYVDKGLDRISLRNTVQGKTRLRWQVESPGLLWHGDVCHGPQLVIGNSTRPLRIHALLDDASRYIVAIEAHHSERELDMLGLFVRALRRHGPPEVLYLDNGSTYRGDTLRLGCARLGIQLLHARPYDAPARGKMERFWRTLREGCLDHIGSISSLVDIQARLDAFVDKHYHPSPHGGLVGKSPATVFATRERSKHLTEEHLRHALTVHEKRRVRNDTTISVDGKDWELDQGYLAGHVVTVGRNLVEPDAPPWVEHEKKRLALHPVDPVRNARRKRPAKQTAPAPPNRQVQFDPISALMKPTAPNKPKTTEEDSP